MVHAVPRPVLVSFIVRFLLLASVVGTALPAWAENASRWPKLEEVIVVSKTHFDIGYTDVASRVVERYRTSMADQALKLAAGHYRFILEGFNQKRDYARKAAALVDPAIEQRMDALVKAVNVSGRRVVVFNPLPRARDGAVDAPRTGAATALTDVASRETIAAAVDKGRLRFVAKNLPPLGYRTFVPLQPAPQGNVTGNAGAPCIENKLLRVTLDPVRCGIKSIIDKRTGRELVNAQSPYALGQYLYERFDADQGLRFAHDYVTYTPKQDQGTIDALSKPHLPSAPRGIIADATHLRVTLYAGEPWLDLEWSITNKTPDPWPEGGWLCFPLRAECPTFRLARLGSIVDPAKDLVRSSNHDIFCLNGGLTVEGAEGDRTGICPIDARLVSLERQGLWHFSRDFVAHKPDVFVMLFNNVYSTNFAQWINGSWSSRVRLWAIDQHESTPSALIGNSWEARVACLAAVSDAAPGEAPAASGRPDRRETGVRRGGPVQPRAAGHGFRPQSLWRRDAVATLGAGRRRRHVRRSLAPWHGHRHRAALQFARPANRLAGHGIRAGRVYRDDPAHGSGEFHPLDANAGITALSRRTLSDLAGAHRHHRRHVTGGRPDQGAVWRNCPSSRQQSPKQRASRIRLTTASQTPVDAGIRSRGTGNVVDARWRADSPRRRGDPVPGSPRDARGFGP
jgi:hypothetical protein